MKISPVKPTINKIIIESNRILTYAMINGTITGSILNRAGQHLAEYLANKPIKSIVINKYVPNNLIRNFSKALNKIQTKLKI